MGGQFCGAAAYSPAWGKSDDCDTPRRMRSVLYSHYWLAFLTCFRRISFIEKLFGTHLKIKIPLKPEKTCVLTMIVVAMV